MRQPLFSILRVGLAALVALSGAGRPALNAAPEPTPAQYVVLGKIVIGGAGGWDYLMDDARAHRVFVSRGDRVEVVDTNLGKVVGTIPNTQGVHGIAIARRLGRGFTSNGRDNSVTIFDLKTLKEIGRTPVGTGPDSIVYDPASARVFTGNGRSQDTTAVDAATGKVAGTIDLGGRPESSAADGQGHVYIDIESKNSIVEIDSKALKIMNTWPVAPGDSPAGLAVDARRRRLFITCHNGMMVVMDADNGKVVATPAIGQGTDAARFDPGAQIALSSNGGGTLTLVHEDTPDTYSVTTVKTESGARTMALDRRTHRIYLMTAKVAPAPPLAPGAPPRPRWYRNYVPGSAALLVVGPADPAAANAPVLSPAQ
ncbi:MAG TPA: YncE family protein [Armatimonadota bacterium]|nr:YncE family protein [Armatimonadota bacterium]